MNTATARWFVLTILVAGGFGLPASAAEVLHRGGPVVTHAAAANDITATDPVRVVSPRGSFPDFPSRIATEPSEASTSPDPSKNSFAAPAVTVSSALAVVLGLFAALVWLTRKYGSRSLAAGYIPKEVMQSLGSTPIDPRTRVTMLRCGNRILVLAQSASGVQPLAEINDPEEVRRLTAACLGDSKQAFASTLRSLEQESSQVGFLGEASDPSPAVTATPRDRGRLFATA